MKLGTAVVTTPNDRHPNGHKSRCRNPLLNNGIHVTPREVITDPIISDEMEKYLGKGEIINTRQTLLKSHPKKTKIQSGQHSSLPKEKKQIFKRSLSNW